MNLTDGLLEVSVGCLHAFRSVHVWNNHSTLHAVYLRTDACQHGLPQFLGGEILGSLIFLSI